MPTDAHRFRFFVDVSGAAGTSVQLADGDHEHVRVLRLSVGADVEIIDRDGTAWVGRVEDGLERVQLVDVIADARHVRAIALVAGALTGNRFDELVDGAVQAGASTITPFVTSAKDQQRLTQRRERLQRLAIAAAKQSKQSRIASVHDPIDADTLLAMEPGIVFDASATDSALEIALPADGDLRVLIGPAEGLDPVLVSRLVDTGWTPARLGPSILRAELAAPVAIAILTARLDAERDR